MNKTVATGASIEFDLRGSGPSVLLLHAFPLSRAMWRDQTTALAAAGLRAIAPDFRGFGGSSPFTTTPSLEQLADDSVALLDALELAQPVVVCGLSLGGYVALALARRHPSRLRALVLADSRAEADTPEGKAKRDKLMEFAGSHSAAEVTDLLLGGLLSAGALARKAEVVDQVRGIASAQAPSAIVAALRALRDRPDSTPSLGLIGVPTLVLCGSEDTLTPPAASRTLLAAIPGARMEEIPDAGHLSNLEQPERFNAALLGFLRSLAEGLAN